MFTYPTQKAHKVSSNPSQKGQSPPKARPQSPYGLHRFSYTTNANGVPQTTLSRTPSPNKEFRKVSSAQSNAPVSPVQDGNSLEFQPRSISPGSVRSLHTNNTANTFDTSVLSVPSEGNVNRDLSKWFQTSTKDPKLSFLQCSLISVVKSSSRSSTPTRALSHNASFLNGASSVSMVSERLSLSTPHANSAWREQYQEVGRDRVELFMNEDNVDYLGLAETVDAHSGGNSGEDMSVYDPIMSLEQRRSLKDAQDGIMSVRAMGDVVLGGSVGGGSVGGVSISASRMMSEAELAEHQSEETHRRRQRRILQLVRDFCTTSAAASMSSSVLKDAESTTGMQSRHQLIVAAKEALREATRAYTAQIEQAAIALSTYAAALAAQNNRYFAVQQQLLDSEEELAATGEGNRELLSLVQEEFRRAADRVGTSALQALIARYPQSWFPPESGEGDGESVYSRQYSSAARPRANSNMSMSELSTHTYNPHHSRYNTNPNNSNRSGAQLYASHAPVSPRGGGAMPDANTFSAPWVYNVNPAVASKLASNATTGYRYYGPPSTDRRAVSPNQAHRNTSIISTGAYYSISESLSRPTSASRGRAAPIQPEHDDYDDNDGVDGEVDTDGNTRASSRRGRSGSRSGSTSNNRGRSRSRSRSRSRGRYATINGPPPPPGTFAPPPRATSSERGKEGNRRNRTQSENDVSGGGSGNNNSNNSSNRDLHKAIGQLEASRQSLYASTASSSSRNKQTNSNHRSNTNYSHNSDSNSNVFYQSPGPVSLLKEAADAALQQELHYLHSGTYPNKSTDLNNGTYTQERVNYGTASEGAKVRRGSNASLASALSNVSHLSVSTGVQSHSNPQRARLHPSQRPEYTYTDINTSNNTTNNTTKNTTNNSSDNNNGLKRSPPRSAASHRLGQQNTTLNTTSNTSATTNATSAEPRYGIMRRPSGATESTDANYSGTRYSDYRFDDLHSTTGTVSGTGTGPALYSEKYETHNNNSDINNGTSTSTHTYRVKPNTSTATYKVSSGNSIRSISSTNNTNPNSNVTVPMYAPQPVSYTTFDNESVSSGANAKENVIKGIRRPPPYYNTNNTMTSPNSNIDRSHISSSDSDTDDSTELRHTQHNTTVNSISNGSNVYRGSSGAGGKSNAKIFTFQNAVSYVSAMDDANPNTGTNTNINSNSITNPNSSTNLYSSNNLHRDNIEDYYNTQYAPAARTNTLKQTNTTGNNNKLKSVPGWTLSKYKTDANTGSPTSGNRGRSSSGHVQSNAPASSAPTLYVYRGRPTDTTNTPDTNNNANTGASVLLSPTTTNTKRSSSTTSIRRGTPKVPVPIVVEYPTNRDAMPFQNDTQADMASYIESMRKMRY